MAINFGCQICAVIPPLPYFYALQTRLIVYTLEGSPIVVTSTTAIKRVRFELVVQALLSYADSVYGAIYMKA